MQYDEREDHDCRPGIRPPGQLNRRVVAVWQRIFDEHCMEGDEKRRQDTIEKG